MDEHLRYLDECAELHQSSIENGVGGVSQATPMDPLDKLCLVNPDLMLEIAKV